MYITTQVANWLTKRFWSNQAGDSLMQFTVVGMTLAMGLMATNWQLEGLAAAKMAIKTNTKTIQRQIDDERKFKSSDGVDVNLRKIHADVDGAGRADVGHGADVGDLVDGAYQLVVGDRGVQLKNQKIGEIIHRQIERKFKSSD